MFFKRRSPISSKEFPRCCEPDRRRFARCKFLQARPVVRTSRNVYAGAVKIVVFGDNVPEVDADAELHPFVLGDGRVALRNLVLYLDTAANGLDDAGELGDDAVPCAAEDVTADARRSPFSPQHGTNQSSCGGFFVKLRKVAVPLHIGGENRSKPTLHG